MRRAPRRGWSTGRKQTPLAHAATLETRFGGGGRARRPPAARGPLVRRCGFASALSGPPVWWTRCTQPDTVPRARSQEDATGKPQPCHTSRGARLATNRLVAEVLGGWTFALEDSQRSPQVSPEHVAAPDDVEEGLQTEAQHTLVIALKVDVDVASAARPGRHAHLPHRARPTEVALLESPAHDAWRRP